jgi:hypothetical protein
MREAEAGVRLANVRTVDGSLATMVRAAARGCLIVAFAVSLGGCAWISSWFPKPPKASPPAPVAAAPQAPEAAVDAQPAAAARVACANYAQVVESAPFPRDAIIRGIDAGRASVRFLVDVTTISVLSLTSSDPAFGDAAVSIVRKLQCRVDRPTRFEIPFDWRTSR